MTQEEYLEEQIKTFPGYANPFWYERNVPKYNPEAEEAERIKYEWQKKRPNPVHQGTQPDIEIRWKNYPKQAGTNHMIKFFEEWK